MSGRDTIVFGRRRTDPAIFLAPANDGDLLEPEPDDMAPPANGELATRSTIPVAAVAAMSVPVTRAANGADAKSGAIVELRGTGAPPMEPASPVPPPPSRPAAPSPPTAMRNGNLPPPLAPSEAIVELRNICLAHMEPAAVAALPPERLAAEVEKVISAVATDRRIQLNAREQRALATELVHDMVGLGPLEPLLADDGIADIMVNGPHRIFVERHGKVEMSTARFRDTMHLINVCQRIAVAVGRRVDESSPMVDARLKDGSRVNIVFPPLALDGPYLSIRKFGKKAIDFDQLVGFGTMTQPVARVLKIAARIRLNVIISGGTGSGKTTLMNAMSQLVDHGERVVTVEDAAELQLQQPHVVRLETRPSSLEGRGEITQRDLVRNALRMRPDRIIVGEVRGGEAFDMLQAMNTGHDGSMSTVHANTTRDALSRIENMVQMGNVGLPSRAIRTQIAGAIDLIVQVARQRDGTRRVIQVSEVCGTEGDIILLNDIFHFEMRGVDEGGRIYGDYKVTQTPPSFQSRIDYFGLSGEWMEALRQA